MSVAVRALVVLLALVLAATPLSLLLAGSSWLTLSAVAALAVAGVGAALRPWVPLASLVPLGQGLALVLVTIATEAASGALVGVSGPLGVLAAQPGILVEGVGDLGTSRAPVELSPAASAVMVVLLGLVALAVDLLAIDLDHPGPAGLLLGGFALVPALAVPDGGPWWTIAGPVAGALLLWALPSLTGPRGRAVALVALALVLGLGPALAPAVPHDGDPPVPLSIDSVNRWTGRDAAEISGVMIDDSVSVRRDLLRAEEQELLRYTTDAEDPGYLRLHTLTVYRDGTWERGGALADLPAPSDRRSAPAPLDGIPRYDISITALTSDALPAPANIPWADTGSLPLQRERDPLGELRLEGTARPLDGAAYSVQSAPPAGDEEQLRAMSDEDLRQLQGDAAEGEVPPLVTALADQVRQDAGAGTAYDTARAYEEHFRTTFSYDLEARTPPGEDPVVSFLQDRSGYCEQFAATFALMMRSQGYSARVAIGFTGGSEDGDEHVVTNHSAHAWPEVWFGPDLGWVRFEPTPAAAANGVEQPDYAPASEPSAPAEPAAPTTEAAVPSAETTTQPAPSSAASESTAAGAERSDASVGPALLGILGVLAALTALALAAAAVRSRAHRRERAWDEALASDDPRRASALLAWDRLRERGTRARGLGRRREDMDPAQPPREAIPALLDRQEARGVEVDEGTRAAAARLGAEITRALYAPPTRDADRDEDAVERARVVRADTATVLTALRRRPPRSRQRRGSGESG